MLIASIITLRDYFKTFADAQDVAFVYGPARKLIEKSKSDEDFNYPILHLNRPMIKPVDNGMANYMSSFYIELCALGQYKSDGTPDDNDLSELTAEHNTLVLLQALEKQMMADNNYGKLLFELNSVVIEPVMDTFVDYHTGWKMSFRIDFFADLRPCL